ncbi:MAG: acetolactate synthase small subunit [Synergistaceae bacterium]|nr:acetolactate synthase small subunit [Synergistaceae bacterium]
MRRTFSVLTQDSPGVLMRIANLIYRRNYNIASLSVSETDVPGVSRFTIVIEGDEWALEQVGKQLGKLIEVLSVENLNSVGKFVERWLSLIKVRATMATRPHILQIADVFRCRVVDMGSEALTLELTGDKGKMEACTEALRPYGIIEIAGSGSVALSRSGFVSSGADKIDVPPKEQYGFQYMLAGAGSETSPVLVESC